MRALTILYVEDHKLLRLYVKDLLEAQGWRVDTCQDGMSALEIILNANSYDVFIFDNDLPGLSGLELVRQTRRLTHRRRTPTIIMLSAINSLKAARRVGADACLKKPDEIDAIIETVTRLTGAR
jgi:CheY-like chemotaxis protein